MGYSNFKFEFLHLESKQSPVGFFFYPTVSNLNLRECRYATPRSCVKDPPQPHPHLQIQPPCSA